MFSSNSGQRHYHIPSSPRDSVRGSAMAFTENVKCSVGLIGNFFLLKGEDRDDTDKEGWINVNLTYPQRQIQYSNCSLTFHWNMNKIPISGKTKY